MIPGAAHSAHFLVSALESVIGHYGRMDFRDVRHQAVLLALVDSAIARGAIVEVIWDRDGDWVNLKIQPFFPLRWDRFDLPAVVTAEWLEDFSREIMVQRVMES